MAISDNVQAKAEAIDDERLNNPGGPFPIAQEVQQKAISAILGGTVEWIEYVRLFADPANPAELARLIPTDGTHNDPVRREARAYLAANGMCGETTTGTLMNNVTVKLD